MSLKFNISNQLNLKGIEQVGHSELAYYYKANTTSHFYYCPWNETHIKKNTLISLPQSSHKNFIFWVNVTAGNRQISDT
jgi:hypothetical protein